MTAKLRKVGGSVMLAVPPALLEILCLKPGAVVGLTVEEGRLVIEPQQKPHYTLDELLAECDPKARFSKQEREWMDSGPPAASSSDEPQRDVAGQPRPSRDTSQWPRALDLAGRGGRRLESAPDAIVDEVLARVAPVFE